MDSLTGLDLICIGVSLIYAAIVIRAALRSRSTETQSTGQDLSPDKSAAGKGQWS